MTSTVAARMKHDTVGGRRQAFTLVEMLVVISILSVLMALLFPAVQAARESGRQTACKSNLRQVGIGLAQHADKFGTYCSGAFDWLNDGAVTEVGWVADLVHAGIPVGDMLCPSNPNQVSATYNDLLNADTSTFDTCVNRLGNVPKTQLDGTTFTNPCRQIAATPLSPGSPQRIALVQSMIYSKHYNTNYTASWWLVRSGVMLDTNGNLTSLSSNCAASLTSRSSTIGPLGRNRADSAAASASYLPLMGCGAASALLTVPQLGPNVTGASVTLSFTPGPVVNPTMQPLPGFPAGTPQTGAGGWWAGWNATIQDYRGFGPVHHGLCNILMADGSVQSFNDLNNDHYLNNGFTANGSNGFADSTVEASPDQLYSRWSLQPQ